MSFTNGDIVCTAAHGGIISLTNNGSVTATGVTAVFTVPDGVTLNVDTVATGVLTLTGQPADTQTVIIDSKTYTFQTVLTDVDGNVLIGATTSDSIDNLIAAITLGAGAGTTYATSTILHPTVTATDGAGLTMNAAAKTAGTAGNSIATTTTVTGASWGAATLTGGVDGPTLSQGTFAGLTWTIVSLAASSTATADVCFTIDDSQKAPFTITYVVSQDSPEEDISNNTGTRILAGISCEGVFECLDDTDPISIGDVSSNGNDTVFTINDTTQTVSLIADNVIQTSTDGGFTPAVMTSVQALAITPTEGMMLFVTDISGVFTDIGHWGYMNGNWTFMGFNPAGGATVVSVFGRTGAVVAATNDYTWAQIDKTTSDIADIATRAHGSLTDVGTNTHAQIDTHIADATIHETAANLRDRATHTGTQLASTISDFTAASETAIFTVANFVDSATVNFTATPGASVTAAVITGAVDHNSLLNYNSDQHIDWKSTTENFNTSGSITGTGVVDFGGATSLEIPNSAAPTVNAAGEIAIDTTIADYTGMIKYYDGTEELTVLALPTSNLVTTDGFVFAYNATNNEIEMVANAGAGNDPDAIHDNISGEISIITPKATPVSGDFFIIEDSAASNSKKALTFGNLESTISLANVAGDITDVSAATNWRLFYSNGSSVITELALGASGTLLQSNGASAAPTWVTNSFNLVDDTTPQLGGDLDTNTNNIVFSNGTAIQTGTGAGNTALLQAYDVDGASYTTFGTLTANNTPTFDLSASVTIGGNAIISDGDTGTVTNGMLAGSIAASKFIGTDIATVGTIATGTWEGTTIAVDQGGTGQTSYTDGQLLIGNTTGNTLAKATLTAGDGVVITNGGGSITLEVDPTGLTSLPSFEVDTDLIMVWDDSAGELRKTTPDQLPIAPYSVTTSAAGNYSALSTDQVILKTGITGGGDTVTLPTTGMVEGQVIIVKDGTGTAGTNNITVDVTGALSNIDGAASYVMNTNYESVVFMVGTTQYNILSAYLE